MNKEQKKFIEEKERLLSLIASEFQRLECKAGLQFIAELRQLLEEDDKQEVEVIKKIPNHEQMSNWNANKFTVRDKDYLIATLYDWANEAGVSKVYKYDENDSKALDLLISIVEKFFKLEESINEMKDIIQKKN